MIVGLGTDLTNMERINAAIQKFGFRFVNKVFSNIEIVEMNRRAELGSKEFVCMAAKRFAAKEACSKALGTGLQQGTFWRDMEITHLPSGKPQLNLKGAAAKHAKRLCSDETPNVLVSMSDDWPYAQAFVIIEKS